MFAMDWTNDFGNNKNTDTQNTKNDDFEFDDFEFEDNENKKDKQKDKELNNETNKESVTREKADNEEESKAKKDIQNKNKNNKRLNMKMDYDDEEEYQQLESEKKSLSTKNAQRVTSLSASKDPSSSKHLIKLEKPHLTLSGTKVTFPQTAKNKNRRFSYQQTFNSGNLRSSTSSSDSPFVNKKKLSFDNTNLESNLTCEDIEFMDNNFWKSKNIITDEVDMLMEELISSNIANKVTNEKISEKSDNSSSSNSKSNTSSNKI